MMEIALIENVQREDLNVIEEAMGYKSLIDRLGLTQEDVAKRVSKSRSHVTNLLRLLKLPEATKIMVAEGKLSMGHVRPLIMLENDKDIERFAQQIYNEKLSARDAETLVKEFLNPNLKHEETKVKSNEFAYAISLFEDKLQTRIEINNKKLVIHFNDDDDLNRIMEELDVLE